MPDVVRVTVNGVGEILDIELAPGCQPHLLGDRVTRAVANARRQAAGGVPGGAAVAALNELEALVAERTREFKALQQKAAEAAEKIIGEPVAGGVGLVQVDITYVLLGEST